MKVAGVFHEGFDFCVCVADAREVRVVECERQPRYAADHSLGFARVWRERTDVGLDRENDVVCRRLLYAPSQLFLRSLPRFGGGFFLFEVNARQRRYVWRTELAGIFERAQEFLAGMLSAAGVWLIDRVRDEIRIELQENVGGRQAAVGQLVSQ